jgi:hypothetical protein
MANLAIRDMIFKEVLEMCVSLVRAKTGTITMRKYKFESIGDEGWKNLASKF